LHFDALAEISPWSDVAALLDDLCANSTKPTPPFWRAARRIREGKYADARLDFAEARRRGGLDADIKLVEADLLRAEGDLDAAAALVLPSEVLEANRGRAWQTLGRLRELQGKTTESQAAYENAWRANPKMLARRLNYLDRHRDLPLRERDVDDLRAFILRVDLPNDERTALLARLGSGG
jgi:predicted Zn-dependent protease